MKKSLRIVLLVTVAIAAAAAYVLLHNPLNSLVKASIEKFGSELTETRVRVSSVDISPVDGKGRLSGLSVGNPSGFKATNAFEAGTMDIVLEPGSLTEDVILIRRIAIESPKIAYEKQDDITNFEALQRNIERQLGKDRKQQNAEQEPARKMIIESLTIRNTQVNYNGLVDLKLPDIELRNIGKRKGGATSAEVARAIIRELNTRLTIELAKTVAVGAVGGVAVGIGLGIKKLIGD